ncbi:transmembrane protein 200C-like [Coregonus clupeaformis]|uniref:transmembrane protein 200C-like n=1 Tax=Coregonus clupeaformis TaxID=59861 RepID=UPI001E1C8649|nr:transmembrane protein 200C-like [Coregonus clupeaformis]
MIATGGLLRINRGRQDSQNQAENKRRKQAKRKKNDVVVVKGKLNLRSPSGLLAAVGVVVLMVGIAMAVLGYWPHEGHSQGYTTRVSPGEERTGNGRTSYSKSPLVSATWSHNNNNNTANQTVGELTNQTVGELTNQTVGELTNQTVGELTNQTSVELTNQTVGELTNQTVGELTNQTVGELTNQTSVELTNQTVGELTNQTVGELTNQTVGELTNQTVGELTNQTVGELTNQTVGELTNQTVGELTNQTVGELTNQTSGFISDFLDNYLYSDNLKVFGPLVMGIGIFIFICANAVLHENRDQKTKVIDLRDIYSTVIDLHNTRTKDYSPSNGLVNYVQPRGSVDVYSGSYNPGGILELGCSSWLSNTGSGHQGESVSAEQQSRRPSMAGRQCSWSRDNQTFTDTVYSIYRDQKRRCSEQVPCPRQWDSEQASYPSQWDSEQASYPSQWDSEQASYPSQWDSEQASYPSQWDSEQASYPSQWDSEQASYPSQWEGTGSIVSSSVNAFKLPVIKLNNCEVEEERGQAEREETEGCSEEEIIKVKDFSENGIEEEQVAGYSQGLGTKEKDASRTSLNPQEAYNLRLDPTDKDASRRASSNPQGPYNLSLDPTEKDASRRGSLNPQEAYNLSLDPTGKDAFRRSSTSLTPQEYTEGLEITLTEHQGGATGTDPHPTGLPTIPPPPTLTSPG